MPGLPVFGQVVTAAEGAIGGDVPAHIFREVVDVIRDHVANDFAV